VEAATPSAGTAIVDATEAFLAKCQNRGVVDATLRKYKTFVKQLIAYCESRGYLYVDQLSMHDMDRFYALWKDGVRSKGKKLDKLKSFVKSCLKRKWLAENIADDLEPPMGSSGSANKTPFTDDELKRIYAACDAFGPPITGGAGSRPWGGEDAKDFVMLAVYTGLRISDICLFDTTKRLNGNDVFLRMHKTKKELFIWIPVWLVARLRAREQVHGSHIFLVGQSMNLRTVTEQWRRRMRKIFKLAGPWEESAHPHRFRATFARILPQNGVEIQDVAELIGDTPAIVAKHYAKWVTVRQDRLRRILQEAFDDKPKPKIVAIR
jgi:integrase